MNSRLSLAETFDAELMLRPLEHGTTLTTLLVKRTYRVEAAKPVLIQPEPLRDDFRDPSLSPRFRAGTDFWPAKKRTDIVIHGSAFAPQGRAHEMDVLVRVGDVLSRHLRVRGPRTARVRGSDVQFSAPESFEEIALDYSNCYGGRDARVVPGREVTTGELVLAAAQIDHPGAYPRNPHGKGFVVYEMDGEVALPSVEDPVDLLTPARLLARDPAAWFRQPLSWCFDWLPMLTFPRYRLLESSPDAWFPSPDDDRLPEVARGFLPVGFASAATALDELEFCQEASLGMACRIDGGEAVMIAGMHPERKEMAFALPILEESAIFSFDGATSPVPLAVHHVEIWPTTGVINIVQGATFDLGRMIIPGVHKYVDVIAKLRDGEVRYQPPPTLHDLTVAAAQAERRST